MIEWLQANQCIISSETKTTIHSASQKNKCCGDLFLLSYQFPAVLFLIFLPKMPSSFVPAHPSHSVMHIHALGGLLSCMLRLLFAAVRQTPSSHTEARVSGHVSADQVSLLQVYPTRLFPALGCSKAILFLRIPRPFLVLAQTAAHTTLA